MKIASRIMILGVVEEHTPYYFAIVRHAVADLRIGFAVID